MDGSGHRAGTAKAVGLMLLVAALTAGRAHDCHGAPTFITKWGTCGRGTGQFCGNNGVFVAADGSVYVCDTGCPRVQVFTPDGGYIRSFGAGHLDVAFDVVVDSNGNAYVTDATAARIAKFDSKGGFLAYLPVIVNGGPDYPKWIAIDPFDHLYFTVGNFVVKYDVTGTRLAIWGGYGSAPGMFRFSTGIAVTPSGRVLVADAADQHIQEFLSTGTFVRRWDIGIGTDPGELHNPAGVAVDSNGDVYVVDDWYRVHQFSPEGVHLEDWGTNGRGDGEFIAPYDVAVGDRLTLFVSDQFRCDVQKFQDPSTPTRSTTWGRLKLLYR